MDLVGLGMESRGEFRVPAIPEALEPWSPGALDISAAMRLKLGAES